MDNNIISNQPIKQTQTEKPLSVPNFPDQPKKIRPNKLIILIIGVILIVSATAYGSFLYWNKINEVLPDTTQPIEPQQEELNSTIQWNGEGILLPDQKLIVKYQDDLNPSISYSNDIKYYDMGANGDNKIIMAIITEDAPFALPVIFFFEQTPNGYIFMSKSSDQYIYNTKNEQGYILSTAITSTDTKTIYNDVIGPKSFEYHGISLENQETKLSDLFKNYVSKQNSTGSAISIQKVDTIDIGDVYLRKQKDHSFTEDETAQFYGNSYILKLHSGLYTIYDIHYNFFSDNLVPNITWSDGTKNEDTYKNPGLGGCGSSMGAYLISSRDVSGAIKQTGTTNTRETIYEFKNINDPEIKFFYDKFGGVIYNAGQSENVSIESWYTHHPVILYKNAIGDYVIFTNEKYGTQAECGKPVIYLYPTQTTNVRVQVGANITKSEPTYNKGWFVQANPNGFIKNSDGKIYDSLFWEGTGNGTYPTIKEGFVIPKTEIEIALRSQLKDLGLSEKESADFMIFWLPKMPSTPYIRLTWFTTKQLDELAPLIVWPKPNTSIRVFLDFEGLQKFITLPVQHLSQIPREGFTIVEWGGILRK
jgi:hypothetical protein